MSLASCRLHTFKSLLSSRTPTISLFIQHDHAASAKSPQEISPRRNFNAVVKSREYISLVGRNFLTLKDYTNDEIKQLLWTSMDLKKRMRFNDEVYQPLIGKSLAMVFEKRSTRTRMSTEAGFAALGGHPLFLSSSDIHLGVNENLRDTAKVMSRLSNIIFARVYDHETLRTLARDGTVPVINGLCNKYHPLQILADFMTLQEHFGCLRGLTVAWVGDGNNNVTHSFMMGCPKLGMNLRIAAPKGYDVNKDIAEDAKELCLENGTTIHYTTDPREAVQGADVIVTDTFVSMGVENEKEKRLKDFTGFQVNEELCSLAKQDHVFLHCLPRKPEEVTDGVFYSKKSLVWPEAENRKWTVMTTEPVWFLGSKSHVPPTRLAVIVMAPHENGLRRIFNAALKFRQNSLHQRHMNQMPLSYQSMNSLSALGGSPYSYHHLTYIWELMRTLGTHARVYDHEMLRTLAREGTVPVINGLCNRYRPLQMLADFMTLQEHFGCLRGLTIAWIDDGNNNATHSFVMGCPKLGMNLRIAPPKLCSLEKQDHLFLHCLPEEVTDGVFYIKKSLVWLKAENRKWTVMVTNRSHLIQLGMASLTCKIKPKEWSASAEHIVLDLVCRMMDTNSKCF